MLETFYCIFIALLVVSLFVPQVYQYRLTVLCAVVLFGILGFVLFRDIPVHVQR